MYAKGNILSHFDFITSKGQVKGDFIKVNNKQQIKDKNKKNTLHKIKGFTFW